MTDLRKQDVVPLPQNIPYGFCHCGCGQKTKIATITQRRRHVRRGEPMRYLSGHGTTHERPAITQPVDPSIRYIALTQGQVAIIDTHLYDWLMGYRWCARWHKSTRSFYSIRGERVDGKQRTVIMSRQITGLERGDKRIADHHNHDTLDYTGNNLRVVNATQSACNLRKRRDNTSGLKGTSWNKQWQKWGASICHQGKQRFLGYRNTREEAHQLYRTAAAELHKEFACYE